MKILTERNTKMQITTKQLSEIKMNGNELNLVEANILLKFASMIGEAKVVGEEQKIEGKRGRTSKIWDISDNFLENMKMLEPATEPAEKVKIKAEVPVIVKETAVSKPAKKPTKKSAASNNHVVM